MRTSNSLIVPKTVKGDSLRFFNIRSVTKILKTLNGDALETLKYFRRKTQKVEKGGESLRVPKRIEKGHPSALERFCISC